VTGLPEVAGRSLDACRAAPFHDHVASAGAARVPREVKRDVIMNGVDR
jgi:hypothetical protein